MAKPAFLDAPFERKEFSPNRIIDFWRTGAVAITEEEKELLKKQFPNHIGGMSDSANIYVVWAKRTEYRCSKLADGVFKVSVYAISNRMDTSRPKNTYFLVRKPVLADVSQ